MSLFVILDKARNGKYNDQASFDKDIQSMLNDALKISVKIPDLSRAVKSFREYYEEQKELVVDYVVNDLYPEEFVNENTNASNANEASSSSSSSVSLNKEELDELYVKLEGIYNSLTLATDEHGLLISHIFQRLPSKRSHPDYYDIIKKPIDLEMIRVCTKHTNTTKPQTRIKTQAQAQAQART